MSILEKVEVYGKYFMDLATDEEVQEYWNLVDNYEDYLDAMTVLR